MAHILPQLGAINAHEFDSPMSQTKFNGQKPVGKPDQFFQIFDFRIFYQFDKNSSSLENRNFGGVCITTKTDP